MDERFLVTLRTAALRVLHTFELSGDRVARWHWDDSTKHIIRTLVQESVLVRDEVLREVDLRLKRIGRESYDHCVRYGRYPDHAISPHALAYALYRNQFTKDEVRRLRFDHGDTVASYIMEHGAEDLAERVYNALLGLDVPQPL